LIVLDSHVLLWSQFQQNKLGKKTLALIERRWHQGEVVVPTIAFWEIGMLEDRGRFRLKIPIAEWRQQLLNAGLKEIALNGEIALRALDFAQLPADPADRFIAATALVNHATLLTADDQLLAWHHGLLRQDART
jgi:PIN domain nuclease of toxin-antitoxin system